MIRAKHCLLAAFIVFGLNADGNAQQDETAGQGIRTEIVVSDRQILPFESISVLVLLRNDSKEARKMVASRYSFIEVGEMTRVGIKWQVYDEAYNLSGEASPPYAQVLPPDYLADYFFNLNFHNATGEHVFAHPGSYKVIGRLGSLDILASQARDITVRQPTGANARAYKFLMTSEVRKFLTENTVANFPYTVRTVRTIEKFIAATSGSQYSNLARIGLALIWLKGVDGKRDISKSIALLIHVTAQAKEPLASRANYYLGLCALEQGVEAQAREYFEKSLHGKPDPFFKYLCERALADQGFRDTRSLHQSLLRPRQSSSSRYDGHLVVSEELLGHHSGLRGSLPVSESFLSSFRTTGSQKTGPAAHFAKARQLIEDNCGDCMGRTREGLEEGIRELVGAIDQGYKNRIAAYKLLAQAYNTQTIYITYDSQEYQTLLNKIKPVYQKLSKLAPRDPEVPFDYAIYLKDEEDQLAAYRKALLIDSHYAPARFVIARIHIIRGQLEAGIKEMTRAVRDADDIDAEDYGSELIGLLKVNNRWREAEEIRKLVAAKIRRADIDRRKKKRE